MKEEFIKLPTNSDVRIGIDPSVVQTSNELIKYSPERFDFWIFSPLFFFFVNLIFNFETAY